MFRKEFAGSALSAILLSVGMPAFAGWGFNGAPFPNAFIQAGDMTLELACDRMRFAPAGFEDARDIERKQGLSMRFKKDEARESGAFQAGEDNADIRIVDNFPVEIVFREKADYDFVLDQIGENAVLNLAMIDGDVSYGIFDLQGSGAAIASLRTACGRVAAGTPAPGEAPDGVVYCGGGAITRQIEYVINPRTDREWDARVTVNGKTMKAMTSYSYFGDSVPANFVVALLAEDKGEFLVFSDGQKSWLEFGDYTYRQCN